MATRRPMSKAERKAASVRMKEFWRKRRENRREQRHRLRFEAETPGHELNADGATRALHRFLATFAESGAVDSVEIKFRRKE